MSSIMNENSGGSCSRSDVDCFFQRIRENKLPRLDFWEYGNVPSPMNNGNANTNSCILWNNQERILVENSNNNNNNTQPTTTTTTTTSNSWFENSFRFLFSSSDNTTRRTTTTPSSRINDNNGTAAAKTSTVDHSSDNNKNEDGNTDSNTNWLENDLLFLTFLACLRVNTSIQSIHYPVQYLKQNLKRKQKQIQQENQHQQKKTRRQLIEEQEIALFDAFGSIENLQELVLWGDYYSSPVVQAEAITVAAEVANGQQYQDDDDEQEQEYEQQLLAITQELEQYEQQATQQYHQHQQQQQQQQQALHENENNQYNIDDDDDDDEEDNQFGFDYRLSLKALTKALYPAKSLTSLRFCEINIFPRIGEGKPYNYDSTATATSDTSSCYGDGYTDVDEDYIQFTNVLQQLPNLRKFHLEFLSHTIEDREPIAASINDDDTLNNSTKSTAVRMTTTKIYLDILLRSLSCIQSLQEVTITCCKPITSEEQEQQQQAQHLQQLNHHFLSKEALYELCFKTPNLKKLVLRHLQLNNNDDNDHMNGITQALEDKILSNCDTNDENNNSLLEKIELIDHQLGNEGGYALAHVISILNDKDTNTSFLKDINLSNSGLMNSGAVAFINSLKNNRTVQRLNLSNNKFLSFSSNTDDDDGKNNSIGIAIANTLQYNTTLIDLNLSNIKELGDDGCIIIANALSSHSSNNNNNNALEKRFNSTLRHLNLSNTGITNMGVIALSFTLASSSSSRYSNTCESNDNVDNSHNSPSYVLGERCGGLTHLDISKNDLDDVCGIILGEALLTNTTLEELALDHNLFGDETCYSLVNALTINNSTKLKRLDLCFNNNITIKGYERLLFMLHYGNNTTNNTTNNTCDRVGNANFSLQEVYTWAPVHIESQLTFYLHVHDLLRTNTVDNSCNSYSSSSHHNDSRNQWIQAMLMKGTDLTCLFYLIRSNPGLCSI